MGWRVKLIDAGVIRAVQLNRGRIKLHSRRSAVGVDMLGKCVTIYNGRLYNEITISEEMVGGVYGEFAVTKSLGKKIHRNNRLQIKKRKKVMALRQFRVRKKRTLKKQNRKGRSFGGGR